MSALARSDCEVQAAEACGVKVMVSSDGTMRVCCSSISGSTAELYSSGWTCGINGNKVSVRSVESLHARRSGVLRQ